MARAAHLGAVAPGYQADLLVLPDLEPFRPELVLKAGRPVGEIVRGRTCRTGCASRSGSRRSGRDDLAVAERGGAIRVIGLVPDQVVTESLVDAPDGRGRLRVADPARDLAKIAVVERHLATGRVGVGFVRGFGLQRGALASTVAHDAHNLVVLGVADDDMLAAVAAAGRARRRHRRRRRRRRARGVPLPVAGLLSVAPLDEVIAQSRACTDAAPALGWTLATPFLTLSFLALSVIPR